MRTVLDVPTAGELENAGEIVEDHMDSVVMFMFRRDETQVRST